MPHCHLHRRGLAPLELVLALPMLLLLMALMVNFGAIACWKVRALTVARNALWSTRWPRSNDSSPRPNYWPSSAGLGSNAAGNVPELYDSRVDPQVLSGPTVYADLLDVTRGLRQGSANLTRGYAMMGGKMGTYNLAANTVMLDDRWQYPQMGLAENQPSLMPFRLSLLYSIQTTAANYSGDYVNAVVSIVNLIATGALNPLEPGKDDEFVYYHSLFGAGIPGSFYRTLTPFCSTDREVAKPLVQDLINRIRGAQKLHIEQLAWHLANAFLRLYKEAQQGYIARNLDPPPELQQKIDALNDFIQGVSGV